MRERFSLNGIGPVRREDGRLVIPGVKIHGGSKHGKESDFELRDLPDNFFSELLRAMPKADGQRVVDLEVVFQELADEPKVDSEGNLILRSMIMFDGKGELITLKIQNGAEMLRRIFEQRQRDSKLH